MQPKPCEVCDNPIRKRYGRTPRFCSRECCWALQKKMAERQPVPCNHCGKPATPRRHRKRRFCSRECCSSWNRGRAKRRPKPCAWCNAFFLAPRNHPRQKFCGIGCRIEWHFETGVMRGPKHPCWKGGKFARAEYHGRNWARQRKKALGRDGFRCVTCGVSEPLVVHHIKPFMNFADYREANQLDNLKTLCRPCHGREEHATGRFAKSVPSVTETSQPALSAPG
jgi:5-methylcytosine-specific restriction endonuclease McrA